MIRCLAAAAALALAACAPALTPPPGDPLILVAADDKAMNAATGQAQRTLPRFLGYLEDNPQLAPDASVKVALPMLSVDGEEHIWVTPFVRLGPDRFTGLLANQPNNLGRLNIGDPVAFTSDQVSDWALTLRGREYGSFTTRVLLARMPETEADRLRRVLSESPIPPELR